MPPLPVHPAKFTRVLRAWSAGFLLAAGLLATLWVSLEVKKSLEADAAEHFSLVSDQVAVKVRDRLDAYALILRGAAGLFAARDTVRRAAMAQARDSGEASLSGKVELVQETATGVQPGTLMYFPVYRNGAAVQTPEQRRAALLFDNLRGDQLQNIPSARHQRRVIDFHGKSWLLTLDPTEETAYAPDAVLGQDDSVFSRQLDQLCLPRARLPALSAMAATGPVTRHVIELANASQTVLEVALRESHAPGVSHILYLSDITHETEVDRMKSEFLSTAAHELLDLARIEARRGTDFVFEITPVQALVEKVVREFKLPDGRAAPSLIAAAGNLSMRADPQKVQQAILNVLSNAYKYSPAGGVVQIELLDSPAHEGTAAQVGIRIAVGWNWTANSALEPRSRCGGPKV